MLFFYFYHTLSPSRVRGWDNWSHALEWTLVTNMPMNIKAGCHYSTAKAKVNLFETKLIHIQPI